MHVCVLKRREHGGMQHGARVRMCLYVCVYVPVCVCVPV